MVNNEWEAWEAYTIGNRKEIGVSQLHIEQEKLNNDSTREYISAIMGDGNHFIFRPGHSHYDEIRTKATK